MQTIKPEITPPMDTTILLVEDDRLVLHTIARGLRIAGYRILEADSAEAAMDISMQDRPDLALLDMKLPGMSGLDFAHWLKNTQGVPFVFLSAYDDAAIVENAAELGALGYLVKPVDVPLMLPTIRTALQRAQEIQKLQQTEIELSTALESSRSISTAIGLLMQRYNIGADESFDAFRAYCRSGRKRMIDVATGIVERGEKIDLHSYLGKR